MSKNPKIQLVEQFIQALCDHNLDAIDELYAENATLCDPTAQSTIEGKADILKFYKTGFDAGLSARLTGPVRVSGDSAAFPATIELNPGNGEMRIELIDVLRFDEKQKINSLIAYWGPENTSTP
ncbi:SnoaL-like domain [Spongiibacter sp. IMCC21906]|uniref:nuclear transport factor 2 family protein n=1 Tax=Spongiibacter sp. IMCC21906 TaxID=1620392 RepID=UPI00062DF17B|nr:nuclear transport factor 2 family protein [Spongiibacter sp. IMCC21906]AKH69684.1 SnoaL-like domain [Spongiibacter sp. IMCC21906]